jgi:hypothetical protein
MPLTWSIDHAARRTIVTAEGTLTAQDIALFLAAVPAEGALGYRAVFDVRAALVQLSAGDLKAFAALVGKRKVGGCDGAIALVVASDAEGAFASMFAGRTAPSRPVRVFPAVTQALAWFGELDNRDEANQPRPGPRGPCEERPENPS